MSVADDFVARNREAWTRSNAEFTDAQAFRVWAGVDVTPAQLDTARRCQERFGVPFPP
jgi:hypothetical protein